MRGKGKKCYLGIWFGERGGTNLIQCAEEKPLLALLT